MRESEGHTQSVSTFWHGPELSSMELACLLSFVNKGYGVTVFGYEPIKRLPSGIVFVDAREILEPHLLEKYRIRGKVSIAHFSDLFRYSMIKKTGSIWIDADIVCLKSFWPSETGDLFTLKSNETINSAVLAIDRNRPELNELIDRAKAYASGADLVRGSTGPSLLTALLGQDALTSAHRPSVFYPIGYEDWWKPFLPNEISFCEERCLRSAAIHLWNNKIEASGYWKDLAPPANSFLHELFRKSGLLDVFKETCPASVMTQIVENYKSSKYDARYLRLLDLTKFTTGRWISALSARI